MNRYCDKPLLAFNSILVVGNTLKSKFKLFPIENFNVANIMEFVFNGLQNSGKRRKLFSFSHYVFKSLLYLGN